jgi:uncharacterized protein YdeI (YjbR/CyaY-like superfamily)
MPEAVRLALVKHKLIDAYQDRPPYQQNDYVGWIARGKKEDTRQRRLDQMIEELKRGDRYMNMVYKPKSKSPKNRSQR